MMECNKEEAIRAKEIAEKKMQNKDYSGARRVAIKAQQLYPDLENISQLILVCDVHLSAESKAYDNENDWYGILKIDSSADEASIKKQYRKFALLLHPDKNRFAGATDAFKLIGEAHRLLLDPVKRRIHDIKLKNSKTKYIPPVQQPNINPNIRPHPWTQNPLGKNNIPFTNFPTQQQQPTQPTFWTMCPFCNVKYEYYRNVVNKNFLCQNCKKSFTGYEIKGQATSNHPPRTQPNHVNFKPNGGGNVTFESKKKEPVAKKKTSDVGGNSNSEPKSSKKVNSKRKKQNGKSGVNKSDNKSNCDEEKKDAEAKQNLGSSENLRKSNRPKADVSYKVGSPLKKAKSKGIFNANGVQFSEKEASSSNNFEKEGSSVPMEEDLNKVKPKETEKENGEISPDSSPDGSTNPDKYEFPDPDFNDFDKNRSDDCFKVGEMWALYDPLDGMPRFYARIRKILSLSDFKLRVTWLEAEPEDGEEIKWADAKLPISCGILETGTNDTITDRLIFSHRIDWENGNKRDTYKIYPQKGETWALFKDWNMNWHSHFKDKRKYEYEFVEILSDYCEENGVFVAYLGKVKGFTCLFCRIARGEEDSFQIPRNQLFRFSHRVPSFKLSGEEREDVPENSFELDPASFPPNIVEIDIPKDQKIEVETVEISDEVIQFCEEKKMESDFEGNSNPSAEIPEDYEIPEPEFCNFDVEKSPEKFQTGQFWALYSDEDGLPKYYALIKKVVLQPKFNLNVTWLSACPSKHINYADKKLPIGCGIFKLMKNNSSSYTSTVTFSHLLKAEPTDKKDVFAVYPRKSEVWAVYKNWNPRMTRSDLENCEYDIVEVLEENDFAFKTVMLEMVNGHKSVFKSQKNNGTLVSVEILRTELIRFSHQIPAFKLTDEKGGRLRGYWELDLAAFPYRKFCSN